MWSSLTRVSPSLGQRTHRSAGPARLAQQPHRGCRLETVNIRVALVPLLLALVLLARGVLAIVHGGLIPDRPENLTGGTTTGTVVSETTSGSTSSSGLGGMSGTTWYN